MYTVILRGLEFYAYHGVPPEEQVVGHRYKLDLEMDVEGGTDETDSICDTVDYGTVGANVMAIAHGHRYKTVEKLGRTIADRLILEHPLISRVTLTLVKRLPPAAIIAEEAGVRLTVCR